MKPVILIPAYQPGQDLYNLLEQLTTDPQQAILVVNDGSTGAGRQVIAAIEANFPTATVLHHAVNLGKGQALKTGFNHFLLHYAPNCPGLVTADADGQHLRADILRVSAALTENPRALCLGVRHWDETTPLRRKLGNQITIQVFELATGVAIRDTQTGLRGIPTEFLPELVRSKDTGYDFELDMLIRAAQSGREFCQIPIQTIYLENNRGSHFDYWRDSFRIYRVFLRFSLLSLLTTALDYLVFVLIFWLSRSLFGAVTLARLLGAAFQFSLGRRLVFKSRNQPGDEALRFAALALGLLALAYTLTLGLVRYAEISPYLARPLAELALFILSFVFQRLFVYRRAQSRLG